jgi:hypothetical protein
MYLRMVLVKTKNIWIKIILLVGVLLLLLVAYLFLSSPSEYRVDTPLRKELISFQKGSSATGVCAPPGCGPSSSVPREDIKLELTDEQLTALINTLKPKNLQASNIRIKLDSGKIISKATSYYPPVPGNITVVSDLRLNHFYVEKVYIGGIRAPKKAESFIESNGSGLIDKAFQENGVFLKNMRIENNKLIFEASVPKGMIAVEGEVIKINQSPTQNQTNSTPAGNVRF